VRHALEPDGIGDLAGLSTDERAWLKELERETSPMPTKSFVLKSEQFRVPECFSPNSMNTTL
jgi:hypothetical protein